MGIYWTDSISMSNNLRVNFYASYHWLVVIYDVFIFHIHLLYQPYVVPAMLDAFNYTRDSQVQQ